MAAKELKNRTRRIGKDKHRIVALHSTKKKATADAKDLRKRGFKSRVIKFSKPRKATFAKTNIFTKGRFASTIGPRK